MQLDSAIVEALGLDGAQTKVSRHGGSGFSSTARISTVNGEGQAVDYFLKTGSDALMFEGEHASLNAIHHAVPSLAPKSLAFGQCADSPGYFLVTEFLDLNARHTISNGHATANGNGHANPNANASKGSGLSLGEKLAKLHTTPAPPPPGQTQPCFGFPVTTCCGDTPQPNGYETSWPTFYADNRLRAILARIEQRQGHDNDLKRLVEQTATKVVPRLLGEGHLGPIVPVVVHGDLWSGNTGHARIAGHGAVEAVIFDPSACYAHSEYELGMMRMFSPWSAADQCRYHELCPKTEPVAEYDDRVQLYELYHHLNHYAIFGGGYRSGALSILKQLVRRYG